MATKKKRKPIHPLVVKAGLAGDPVFRKRGPDHAFSESMTKWMEDRYEEVCPACAVKHWRNTLGTPTCGDCWVQAPLEGRLWWWVSKKTAKSLLRFLSTYFPDRPETT